MLTNEPKLKVIIAPFFAGKLYFLGLSKGNSSFYDAATYISSLNNGGIINLDAVQRGLVARIFCGSEQLNYSNSKISIQKL